MNKRYMDFVPVKKVEASEHTVVVTPPKAPEKKTEVPEVDDFAVKEIFEEKVEARPAGVSAKLGVIEDLGPRFVKTEVPKRALGARRMSAEKQAERELKEAKAEKLVGRGTTRSALSGRRMASLEKKSVADGAMTEIAARTGVGLVEKPVENSEPEKMKVPKFVNTEKVEKRPLSKNVYQKKVVVPKEEPKGPVTIITKPEKDSRIGTVIAVIITIILGATAGTVAFLLLPK